VKYHRVIAEWLANGRRSPAPSSSAAGQRPEDITVNELALAYFEHAEQYYRKDGEPTTEVRDIRYSIRPLRRLYGMTLARDFGPLQLKAVRQAIVDDGLCRNEINKRTRRIIRMFKWAVSEEMIPPSVHHGLSSVEGLRRGRCSARETEAVRAVPDEYVEAIRAHVPPQIWAMIELMRLTAMRPQEVCQLRTIDLDRSGRVWVFTPQRHKTQHHGRERRIYFGPRAQVILQPWIRADLTAPLFSPREAMQHRLAARRAARKSKVQPSQRDRSKARPKWAPGEQYDSRSFYHAVRYAIRKAQAADRQAGRIPIPDWHPNQLRHSAATRLRKEFSLDVARAVLGHSTPVVTEVYAELDGAKACEVMGKIG
jgi:integrase